MLFLLRPRLRASEDIGLGDHRKLHIRVLEALLNVSVISLDLPRLRNPVRVLAVESSQPVVQKVLGEALCPGSRGGEENHPVLLLPVAPKVLLEEGKALVVRGNAPGPDRHHLILRKEFALHRKVAESQPPVVGSLCRDLLLGKEQIHLPRQDVALVSAGGHALPELRLHCRGLLPEMGGLVQKDQGLLPGEQVQKAVRLRIEVADAALQPAVVFPLLCLLEQGIRLIADPFCGLHMALTPEPVSGLLLLLPDRGKALLPGLIRKHQLRSGVDTHPGEILQGALGLDVEAPKVRELISKELQAVGVVLRQVEDVRDVAPDRELSPGLHLRRADISHGHKAGCELLQALLAPLAEDKNVFPKLPKGHLRRLQGRKCRHHRRRLAVDEAAETADSLGLDLVAAQVRLIEDQILCGIEHRVPVIEEVLLLDLLRPPVGVRDDKPEPRVRGQKIIPAQRIGEVELLRGLAALHQDRALCDPEPVPDLLIVF